ncbi:putative bifunctional diguanylate cyclase/phosphodiesterase [Novosphingobium beihaiensis]|uniref:EAL domain-containing protein n=1 Tax=Novosphingobium beihaiensis TaxID=2930389 RepID=A0ABT0BQS4_9SPHN|nr:EAL domain-containing protein [Novosphingobium beihaiensis]MCJ2187401.1 EAL domain-containing protein [Novosphingobium beihaiensis]
MLSIVAGLTFLALALRDHLRAAAIVMGHALVLTVTLACLCDGSADGIPRSVHMNLLPVGAATFLVSYREGWYLHRALPFTILLIFLTFQLDLLPSPWPGLAAPESSRAIGVWVNNITGTLGAGIVMAMMQSGMNARRTLENDMRQAVARGDYYVDYQPQVDASGRIFGAEALLRWEHPVRGNIPPQEFIPLAEETGLIIPIGERVLRIACAQLAQWAEEPLTAGLTISVNVSASQFLQPDFVRHVASIVALSGADPSRLKLELTESALADDTDAMMGKMQALKDLGIRWSLDDFGTGYSSLSSLKRLPLDQLKIDKSFVCDLLADDRSRAIVDTIVQLSRSLDLAVIAEGVETEEQRQALQAAGCFSYQGFLFSKPLPVEALAGLIVRSSAGVPA